MAYFFLTVGLFSVVFGIYNLYTKSPSGDKHSFYIGIVRLIGGGLIGILIGTAVLLAA